METAMSHYIAILMPTPIGEWRVIFPDLPGCEATALSVEDARFAAVSALSHYIGEAGQTRPRPRDLVEIERDTEWLATNGVDLSKAVITMIPLPTWQAGVSVSL
jgi:predicted RNase H-like HicB family nuclease